VTNRLAVFLASILAVVALVLAFGSFVQEEKSHDVVVSPRGVFESVPRWEGQVVLGFEIYRVVVSEVQVGKYSRFRSVHMYSKDSNFEIHGRDPGANGLWQGVSFGGTNDLSPEKLALAHEALDLAVREVKVDKYFVVPFSENHAGMEFLSKAGD
jgi:hypothetical protein